MKRRRSQEEEAEEEEEEEVRIYHAFRDTSNPNCERRSALRVADPIPTKMI